MVDKIDPTNQNSVEYGQSLLDRKIAQEEKFAKEARKDNRINYAFQALGGVDKLIKDRARRNVMQQNNQLTQDIIREEAEFVKLQKEFVDQADWRNASSVEAHAVKLAKDDLAEVWKLRLNEGLYGDDEKEYQNTVKALSDDYLKKYKENRISVLPFETKEAYTADLRAQLNKEAPSGLLDIALRGVGFRGNKQEELKTKISSVRDTYKDRLRDRPGVKGTMVELSDEAKLALIQAPKQPSKKTEELKKTTVIKNTDSTTGEVTYTDVFGNKLTEFSDLNVSLTRDEINRQVLNISKRYNARYGRSQPATIHSAIDNPNSPYYDLRLADELKLNNLFKSTFNVDTNKDTLKGQIKNEMSVIDTEGQFKNDNILEEQTALGNRYALSYQLLKNGGTKEMYDNLMNRVSEDAIRIQHRGIVDNNGVIQPVGETQALALSHQYHTTQGITKQSKTSGVFGGSTEEFYVYNYQPLDITQFDSEVPVQINRDADGKPDSIEQINRDTEELIQSEEFQTKSPTEQKQVLQNAADQGADINPDLLRPDGTEKDPTGFLGPIKNNVTGKIMSEVTMGVGPEDSQKLIPILVPTLTNEEIETLQNMELEGNVASIPQSIKDKAVRYAQEREEKGLSPFYGGGNLGERPEEVQFELTGNEMILTDEVPSIDETEAFLKMEQDIPRPEFKELTREERIQQSKEERERAKIERDKRSSPAGRKKIKEAREKREDEIKKSVYDTFIDPDRFDMQRIQQYADGRLSKNRKKGSTLGTLGKTLEKYGLENMSIPEIKKWLATKDIKTAYSPSDIQAELSKGNPVFVGDYRDKTGG